MRKYQIIVLAVILQGFVAVPGLGGMARYESTATDSKLGAVIVDVWAPPTTYGAWHHLRSHAGDPSTYVIKAEALGNAHVIVEVEYYNAQNRKVTKSFSGSTTITVGENVSNIRVRAKTTGPTASGVRVTCR